MMPPPVVMKSHGNSLSERSPAGKTEQSTFIVPARKSRVVVPVIRPCRRGEAPGARREAPARLVNAVFFPFRLARSRRSRCWRHTATPSRGRILEREGVQPNCLAAGGVPIM